MADMQEFRNKLTETAAKAAAIHGDYDGCFERIQEWEALPEWEREAHPENYPTTDYEDAQWWRERMAAAVNSILPAVADAWDAAMQTAVDAAEDTTDSFGNLYRIDWLNRMEYERERNPYRAPTQQQGDA